MKSMMARGLICKGVLLVALAGCVEGVDGWEPDPEIWDDARAQEDAEAHDSGGTAADAGTQDATAPAEDASAGPEEDAGTDAGQHDGATQPGDDAGNDSEPCEGFCCYVTPQSGCEEGDACRYQTEGGVRTGTQCEPAGTDREGWLCEVWDHGDSCEPGLFCDYTCKRYCSSNSHCRSTQTCSHYGFCV